MKIGVFDSGIGGITVLSSLVKRFPGVDYVYLGDTANLPYGSKSPKQIEQLSVACAQTLQSKKVDAVVVACNTASSWALEAMRAVMGETPVYGVVDPGVEAAIEALAGMPDAKDAPVLVLATRATVSSQAYGKRLSQALESGRHPIFEQACPLLVPMIEEGWVDHPILHQTIAEYVAPYRERHQKGVALLGCTHYPWIHAGVEAALPGWIVVNSAQAIGIALEQSLPEVREKMVLKTPSIEWIFTDPDAVPAFARGWIESKLGK